MTTTTPVSSQPKWLRLLTAFVAAIAAIVLPLSVTGAALPTSTHHPRHHATTWSVQVGNESADKAIQGMRYLPSNIWIHSGDAVRWTAGSTEIHTVTFLAAHQQLKPFDPTNPLQTTKQGGEWYRPGHYFNSGVLTTETGPVLGMTTVRDYRLSFGRPGTYTYYCLVHGVAMRGTIHVRPRWSHLPYTQAQYDRQAAWQGKAVLADGYRLWAATKHQASSRRVIEGNDDGTAMVMRFVYPTVRVRQWQTVTWANIGMGAPHTVTFGKEPANIFAPVGNPRWFHGGQLSSGIQVPGSTFRVRFVKPGVYHYICALHDSMGMVGTVVVVPRHHH